MTPSAMEARPDVSLARKPAPGVLPTQMPASIGQNRRNKARSFFPASACHTLVKKFGTSSNPAACAGAITSVKQAGRHGRQPHADEALDEAGEQKRSEGDEEKERRHSEQCGNPLG